MQLSEALLNDGASLGAYGNGLKSKIVNGNLGNGWNEVVVGIIAGIGVGVENGGWVIFALP